MGIENLKINSSFKPKISKKKIEDLWISF